MKGLFKLVKKPVSLSPSKGCFPSFLNRQTEDGSPSTGSGMRVSLALLAFPLLGSVPAKPVNWTATVTQAANGALVLGNPRAKVRLVEYVSYTCSHCAHFVGESKLPLKRDYVAKGLVAVELRNAVLNQFDFAAALAARCGGSGRFFGNTETLFATQMTWLGKAPAFGKAQGARMAKLAPAEGLKLIARGIGIDAIMKTRGVTAAQLDACLVSKPAQGAVLAMTKEAFEVQKITGTPSFLINDTLLQGGGTWAVVESALKTALGTS
jgi:protein-disulfide isomerase